MKKIFTTLFVLSALYFSASAQTNNGFEFGINAGLSTATVSNGQANMSASSKTGFNAGIIGEYYFSDRWSIKGKATYDQKGWGNGYITYGTGSSVTTDFNVDYITVPVMANWHFGRARNWYLNFGPYVGFLASAKAATPGTDVKSLFNSTDAGLALGIGVKFKIGDKTRLFLEYDDQGGVTNIFKTTSSSGDILNSRGAFNVGLMFPLD